MKVDLLQDLDHTEREKTKMRLINEVKIMWEHDHDNLVRALCFPQVSESGWVPVMYLKWNGYNDGINNHRLRRLLLLSTNFSECNIISNSHSR